MKQLINIKKDGQIIYSGKLIEVPLKDTFIIQKSIELFDDDDPCIIHKSYVVKGYVDRLMDLFQKHNTNLLSGKEFVSDFKHIDFMETESLEFELVG